MTTPTAPLTQHLIQLYSSLKATNALIARLAHLSFQSGSEPLADSSQSSVRVELAQDIHDTLKHLEEDLEPLKQEAEDLNTTAPPQSRRRDSEKDRDRARLTAQVARLGEDLRHSRSQFRRAQLRAKKASAAAKQKERELVFASLQNPAPPPSDTDLRLKPTQPKHLTKQDLEVDASTTITAALRRTHTTLSAELSRSRFAQETFDESTAALADLGEHYGNLDTLLSRSGNLLGTLVRSQKSDTWYLETAFYLLVGTLVWLVFRRVLLGPFVRVPVFLFRVGWFLVNWVVLKPLLLFLSVTGVATTSTGSAGGREGVQRSRTPLIVQPSAQRGVPRLSQMAGEMPKGGIPAGAGGAGAKVGKKGDASGSSARLDGETSEAIGSMAAGEEQDQDPQAEVEAEAEEKGKEEEEENVTRRADGTVLRERGEGDGPPNRKKKMSEADVEDAKFAEEEERRRGERDEL